MRLPLPFSRHRQPIVGSKRFLGCMLHEVDKRAVEAECGVEIVTTQSPEGFMAYKGECPCPHRPPVVR